MWVRVWVLLWVPDMYGPGLGPGLGPCLGTAVGPMFGPDTGWAQHGQLALAAPRSVSRHLVCVRCEQAGDAMTPPVDASSRATLDWARGH